MATKRFRRNRWEYRIRRIGLLPKPLYFAFKDEAEGDEYVAGLERQLDAGIIPAGFAESETALKTLDQAIKAYTHAVSVPLSDQKLLGVVREQQGGCTLSKVTFTWVDRWILQMKRVQNLAPSTIRHYVGATGRLLDWVDRSNPSLLVGGNPVRKLPKRYATYTDSDREALKQTGGKAKRDVERNTRLEPGWEQSIRLILGGAKPPNKQRTLELKHTRALQMLFELAVETAMRMNEIYTLSVDQVDLTRSTIFLNRTKNGDNRQVPVSSVAAALFEAYLKESLQPDGRLFPWWTGVEGSRERERVTALLSRQFARIFSAAGCPELHFHDLRHEATCRLFERTTLDYLEIAKITGHRDIRSLQRYANLRGSDLAKRMW